MMILRKTYFTLFILTLYCNTQYFEQIPIPNIDATIQNKLTELADKAIQAKTNNQRVDITEIENQVDQLVYQLYDLTEEEIAIIENSTKT
jgi:adenine-specific DNA-methyltransferase